MSELFELWETPRAKEKYMIAGWRQWADAGSISSGLPQYLIDKTSARRIGELNSEEFYLFQIPGTHHFLRPQVKLEQGYRLAMSTHNNEFFYSGDSEKGLVVFLGEEPHLRPEQYADAFFDMVQALGVKRVAAVGGVYGAVPYDKEREISCIYSLREMKDELSRYAVKFSTSIQGFSIENDFKAWYDLIKRFNHMFNLGLDLADLEEESAQLLASIETEIDKMERQTPELHIREYIATLASDFTEKRFVPLGDMWTRGLRDLFNGS